MFKSFFAVPGDRRPAAPHRWMPRLLAILALLPLLIPARSLAAAPAQIPPGLFAKTEPANEATNQNTSVILRWQVSSAATGYQICIDDTGDDNCLPTAWQSIGNTTSFWAFGLNSFTTYYWQVRAINEDGQVEANAGEWWSFTTGSSSRRTYLPLALLMATILNGGFEAGPEVGWTEYSSNDEPIIMSSDDQLDYPPHGGDWIAWLGYTDNETSQLSQVVSVPDGATTLTFWFWIDSNSVQCGPDTGSVYFNGQPLTGFNLCATTRTNDWVRATLPFAQFAGQTGLLEFWAVTGPPDAINSTSSMLIDDVSIQ